MRGSLNPQNHKKKPKERKQGGDSKHIESTSDGDGEKILRGTWPEHKPSLNYSKIYVDALKKD